MYKNIVMPAALLILGGLAVALIAGTVPSTAQPGRTAKKINPCAPGGANPCAAQSRNPCAAQIRNPCVAASRNPCSPPVANPCGR